jgi:drug/metabolite transporter (DMT)-like permease
LNTASDDRFALTCALATVALWSTVASAFKISLRYLDVPQLLFLSSATAAACLLAILVIQKKLPMLARASGADWLRALGFGLLVPFAYYLVLFKAYALLPAQIAQSLNYTWAIVLVILSVPLLGHRVTHLDAAAIAVCYAGVLVICLGGYRSPALPLSLAGIALALASTVIWALYWIGKARDRLDPVVSLCMSFLLSLPFSAAICLYFSALPPLSLPALAGAIWVGLFEMGLTFVLWLLALRHASSAVRVSTLIYITPFLSLALIRLVLDEPILGTTVSGLVLIVSGLLVQHFRRAPEAA